MATPVLTAVMCGYLMLTLLGMHAVPALLPQLRELWSLNNTEAGVLAGAPYITYAIGVIFIGITDRLDARRLMLLGAAINVFGYGGMVLADGFWQALFFRVFQGLGFAWTYLPGVKAINDRARGEAGRATSIYVSSFAFGSSFSILIAFQVAAAYGWAGAFVLPAVSNILAAGVLLLFLPKVEPALQDRAAGNQVAHNRAARLLPNFRAIWRNRPALGFVIAAFSHNFELLAVRSWTVTFMSWAILARGDVPAWFSVPVAAMLLILIGAPCSIAGGEAGHRVGHARAAVWTMAVSALIAAVVGFSAAWPLWLFALLILGHNLFVLADSGTLNAGAMATVAVDARGNLLAGFGLASALGGLSGPVLFGLVLDLSGGGETAASWGWAFASLGLVMAAGSLAVRWLSWSKG